MVRLIKLSVAARFPCGLCAVLGTHTIRNRMGAFVFGSVLTAGMLSACSSANESAVEAKVSVPSTLVGRKTETTISTNQARPRFILGAPAPGLDFTPLPNPSTQPAQANTVVPIESVTIPDKRKAIAAFANAVVKDDYQLAFTLLSQGDRTQIGSPAKFGALLAQAPTWISFALLPASNEPDTNSSSTVAGSDRSIVALKVQQQPSIDEIRGVVASSARVEFVMLEENGGWHAVWRRHKVTQNFDASDAELLLNVTQWAEGRRACATDGAPIGDAKPYANEYDGGLVGEVWLAKTLCTAPSTVSVESAGDFDSILDPQALVDAFGADAYQWARVIKINAPTPFYAIAAPLGAHWVVVGLSSIP